MGYNPSENTTKEALVAHGPLAVSMNMGGSFDGDNIYRCPDNTNTGHAVVIVGYDDSGGYWIVRNSWGDDWGPDNNGYFNVAYDNCAIQKYPYYADASPASGLTIRNVGDADLVVQSISEVNNSCWVSATPQESLPITLSPGESTGVDVSYDCSCVGEGTHYDTIRIESTDPDEDPFDVPVTLDKPPTPCYSLTRTYTGSGSAPTADPPNSDGCPSGQYVAGESITMTPHPAEDWYLDHWTGTDDPSSNHLTMPASNHTVTAHYEEVPPTCYSLTRTYTGSGSDPTADPPNSIDCPSDQYIAGESITMTPHPAPDWYLDHWTGTDDPASNHLTMPASNHTVTAHYMTGEAIVRVGSGSVPPGGSIVIPVEALDVSADGLGAATIEIRYDPTVLDATGCTADPSGVFDSALCNPDFASDTVRLTVVSTLGVSDDSLLAEITFQAVGSTGDCSTLDAVVLTFANPSGNPIPVIDQDGELCILVADGDVNCDGDTNSIDALFILQREVGLRPNDSDTCPPPADGLYLPACDVSQDGYCNSIDALFILQCEVGIPNPFCPALSSAMPPWDGWLPDTQPGIYGPLQTATLSIGSGDVGPGDSIAVPMGANLDGETLGAATIEIQYDPTVVDAIACTADPGGVFDFAFCNVDAAPDRVAFTAISAVGVTGNPFLAEITFQAVGSIGDSSALTLTPSTFADPSGQPISVNVQSGQINIVGPTIPAPTNLSIAGVSQTQIVLNWDDNSSDETAFHIERSPDGSTDWTEIDTVGANVTSYSDTGLDCGTEYHYRVRAYRASDDQFSDYSNVDSATTQACPFSKTSPADGAPGQPTNPTLSWGSSSGAESYEYCIDTTNNSACDGSWTDVGSNTSVGLSGLSSGITYYWQVQARNAAGTTEANSGTWWSFTTQVGLPGTFSKSSPTDGAPGQPTNPTLSWGSSSGAESYEYCIDTTNDSICDGSWTDVGSNTSVGLSGLSSGITYYWQVQARNAAGTTEANSGTWWSFTTKDDSATILLVDDDDNNPDVRSFYTNTLDSLGMTYDIWDTGNSDNEPDATTLASYSTVIWFTGHEFGGFAGPGTAGETALASFLDDGKCLFVSSQDYLYDRGLTTFMSTYLGVNFFSGDVAQTIVTGTGSVFGGLGPYSLNYPFYNYSDRISPDGTAELAFSGDQGDAAVNKDSGVYRTTFWGFPFEALPSETDRLNGMNTVLNWCSSGSPNIVANEVDLGDDDAIEFFNAGVSPVDMTGWVFTAIRTTEVTIYTFPSFTLASGAYVVLHETSGTDMPADLYMGDNIYWYNGADGSASLVDAGGQGVDFVRWGASTDAPPPGTTWTGTNPSSPAYGYNLGRDEFSTDTDDGSDWCSQAPSLGAQNPGCGNTPPTLSGLPDQVFDETTSLPGTIDLWAYASDAETPVSGLTYTIAGTPVTGAGVTIDSNRYVYINPSADWCGYTDVTIRVTDPGGLWDNDTFRVAVTWSCQG
jgi:hypothetical protein